MNDHDHLYTLVIKSRDDTEDKCAQTDQKLLLELEKVLIDKRHEVLFYLEVSKLVEIVQIADV